MDNEKIMNFICTYIDDGVLKGAYCNDGENIHKIEIPISEDTSDTSSPLMKYSIPEDKISKVIVQGKRSKDE